MSFHKIAHLIDIIFLVIVCVLQLKIIFNLNTSEKHKNGNNESKG